MIDDKIKELAQQDNFGTITTLLKDGAPNTQVIWIDADDEFILINTETGRVKFRNVQRDPRVSVVVINKNNPYEYAEVRGRVVETITGDEARSHIDELSMKYTGQAYDPQAIQTERVILKIAPDRQRA